MSLRILWWRDSRFCYIAFKAGVTPVSHTIREKTKLLNRVRRIRGQVEAVERALEQEIGCADVLQLITAARGAINGLMGEVIEDHIRMHLIDPALQTRYRSGPRRRGADRRGAILPQIDLALNSSGYLIRPINWQA
jgi:DNA-binding FrmR family transcriptional regulator